MPVLAELFLAFFRIGLFTFGGGYAMIALIEHTCVKEKKWITGEDMMNVTVIAESTPGPIAINCATFVGYKQAGLLGAVCATLGIVMPSFVIIYALSLYLEQFLEITLVANAFKGIRVAVGLLIIRAGVNMLGKMPKKRLPRAIAAASLCAMLLIDLFALRISSIALMLAAAAVSLALFVSGARARKEGAA